jgi:hypothetical protein
MPQSQLTLPAATLLIKANQYHSHSDAFLHVQAASSASLYAPVAYKILGIPCSFTTQIVGLDAPKATTATGIWFARSVYSHALHVKDLLLCAPLAPLRVD